MPGYTVYKKFKQERYNSVKLAAAKCLSSAILVQRLEIIPLYKFNDVIRICGMANGKMEWHKDLIWYYSSSDNKLHQCYNSLTTSYSHNAVISLFTFDLPGLFMIVSLVLVLSATFQIVYDKHILLLGADWFIAGGSVVSKMLLILVAHDFITLKFPQYTKEVVSLTMDTSISTSSEVWLP